MSQTEALREEISWMRTALAAKDREIAALKAVIASSDDLSEAYEGLSKTMASYDAQVREIAALREALIEARLALLASNGSVEAIRVIDAALGSPAPDPAEAMCDYPDCACPKEDADLGCCRPAPDPAEAMRAKCEAIAREGSFPFDIDVWLNSTKKEMTARVALAIADAIAALKGNGEGR